jgi:hypothetical protein
MVGFAVGLCTSVHVGGWPLPKYPDSFGGVGIGELLDDGVWILLWGN